MAETIPATQVLEEYLTLIKAGILKISEQEKLAKKTARQNEDGSWTFTVAKSCLDEDSFADPLLKDGVEEIRQIRVSAKTAEAILKRYNDDQVYEYVKEQVITNIMTTQNLPCEKQSDRMAYYRTHKKEVTETIKNDLTYMLAHAPKEYAEICQAAKEKYGLKTLIRRVVGPAIANNATAHLFKYAKKQHVLRHAHINYQKDKGYCLKTLTAVMYYLKMQYGRFDFLPSSASKATEPMDFYALIKKDHPGCVSQKSSICITDPEVMKNYRPGTIVIVKDNRHAMVYEGLDEKTGKPKYMGFNENITGHKFTYDIADATLINIPELILEDHNVYQKSAKQIEPSKILPQNDGKVKLSKGLRADFEVVKPQEKQEQKSKFSAKLRTDIQSIKSQVKLILTPKQNKIEENKITPKESTYNHR